MAIKRIEGTALWEDIRNGVVDGKLIRSVHCDKGWGERHYLSEYSLTVTSRCLYDPKKESTKIRGLEEDIERLVDSLVLV